MEDNESAEFGLSRIGQIAVPVSDLECAVAFYRDTLKMHFLFQVPPGLAFFDCAGVRLLLDAAAESRTEKRSSIIYYRVADIHQAFKVLSARGVAFEKGPKLIAKMPDHDLWMAFFRDPDDNLLALMSEVKS